METTRTRLIALDIARALAVIGVVFNHGVDGLLSSGVLSEDGAVASVNDALYIFRMPALALLLGVFIPRSVVKRGKLAYLRHRAYAMLWVYVLWTLLQGSIQVALSSVTNGQMTVSRVLTLWVPIAQFWFLPALVTMTAAVVLLHTWGTLSGRARVLVLLVPAVALWGAAPAIAGVQGFALVLFVGVGAAIGLPGFERLTRIKVGWWTAVGVASLGGFLLLLQFPLVSGTKSDPAALTVRFASILAALLGIVVLLAVAMLMSKVAYLSGALASIGTQTMPIYLMHILVLAGLRVVLIRIGVPPGLFLAIAVPAAVIIPYLVGKYARQMRIGWLFEPPALAATPAAAHR